ncbi:hypothetical protein MiTs_02715 [Microcystis aeruginosa NIES-2521]|uniref:Uncharacterized protein n=1 Tax=Microcystis aeruginosa NIES-2521 TaxID=2303983 RepID=A0A5A5S817_MICAE|nr:hypothetical protein MiTs_02715 [Microcystis aeruginosa NIES-2521]
MTRRDSVSEIKDSVSEVKDSVSELRESVDEVRITVQALLQIAAQQQRENQARQAEIAEIRQRQEESDKRFEVLLSEVRYLIRQIKPDDRQSQSWSYATLKMVILRYLSCNHKYQT